MNERDFHEVDDNDNLLGSRPTDWGCIRLAHMKHHWSTGASACVLHIYPRSNNLPDSLQPRDLLRTLGFNSGIQSCCHLYDRERNLPHECYTREVPESFNAAPHFHKLFDDTYQRLADSQGDFNKCGLSLAQQSQADGNGHTGCSNELKGECEDDDFSYKLTLLERTDGNVWVIHYLPKKSLSPELQDVLKFLGFQEYSKCIQNNSCLCYWRTVPFEGGPRQSIKPYKDIIYDEKNRKVQTWLAAHEGRFYPVIEKLLSDFKAMEKIGLSFLSTP